MQYQKLEEKSEFKLEISYLIGAQLIIQNLLTARNQHPGTNIKQQKPAKVIKNSTAIKI